MQNNGSFNMPPLGDQYWAADAVRRLLVGAFTAAAAELLALAELARRA